MFDLQLKSLSLNWGGHIYWNTSFCRPSCTARKPKPESVIFYKDVHEAVLNGYLPCKICRPMEAAGELTIRTLMRSLENKKCRPQVTKPNTVRRWFKKHIN